MFNHEYHKLQSVVISKTEDDQIRKIVNERNKDLLDEQVFNLLAELPPPNRYSVRQFIRDAIEERLKIWRKYPEQLEEDIKRIKSRPV